MVGLSLAIAALVAAHFTDDSRWDAAGSVGIGVVLIVVAVFLAIEVKSLLLGERADEEIERAVRDIVRAGGPITEILSLITLQQGPGRSGPRREGTHRLVLARRRGSARHQRVRDKRSTIAAPKSAGSSSSPTSKLDAPEKRTAKAPADAKIWLFPETKFL